MIILANPPLLHDLIEFSREVYRPRKSWSILITISIISLAFRGFCDGGFATLRTVDMVMKLSLKSHCFLLTTDTSSPGVYLAPWFYRYIPVVRICNGFLQISESISQIGLKAKGMTTGISKWNRAGI